MKGILFHKDLPFRFMGELENALTPLPYFYDTRKDVASVKSADGLIFIKGQGTCQHPLLR